MNIDIFTFCAQLINFSILLFILNILVYKPIVRAINERNEKIQKTIGDAENKFKEAEDAKNKYNMELKSIEDYKIEQKKIVDDDLASYKSKEIQKIEQNLEKQKEAFSMQLENDKNIIVDEMIKRFCFNIDVFLSDIFASLSDSSLNTTVLNRFLTEIKNITNEDLEKINKSGVKSIDFISSYDLNNEEKNIVENTLKTKGIIFDNINFVVDKNILFGNKIIAGGIVINSNIKNIIDNFTTKLKTAL